jgi:hypothetical protein
MRLADEVANHGLTSSQKGKARLVAAAVVVKYIIVVIQIVIIVVIQIVIDSKSVHVYPRLLMLYDYVLE